MSDKDLLVIARRRAHAYQESAIVHKGRADAYREALERSREWFAQIMATAVNDSALRAVQIAQRGHADARAALNETQEDEPLLPLEERSLDYHRLLVANSRYREALERIAELSGGGEYAAEIARQALSDPEAK